MNIVLPWPPKALSPNSRRWSAEEDAALKQWLDAGKSHKEIGDASGRGQRAVRNRAWRLGFVDADKAWTPDEVDQLVKLYEQAGTSGVLGLTEFAESIGRHKTNVCRKAKALGLETSYARKKVDARKDRRKFKGDSEALSRHMSESTKARLAEKGHPRGALGMKHSPEVKAAISESSRQRWAAMTEEQRADSVLRSAIGRRKAGGVPVGNRAQTTWKAGWREIGDKRIYFRSRWEANYGRYLEWLLQQKQIVSWEHEPAVFWFNGIKRGCVSYLPDFKVTELSGAVRWHEVKGWMDARSATVLKRMAKYHPKETIVLIREKQYHEIRRKVSSLIPGWEE